MDILFTGGQAGPRLKLDFLNGAIDPRITFTRASSATYFGSDGRLATASNDVARFDFDPVTLTPRGLLIEESRTNLLLHSRDMTNAAWSKTDTAAARTQVGLDGVSNSACLMTEGTLSTAATYQSVAVSAGAVADISVVAKRGNTDWVRITLRDAGGGNAATQWFNLATGATSTITVAGAATSTTAGVPKSLGGGWWRIDLSGALTAISTYFWEIASASASGSFTRVNNATYILDCAQLEVGSFATSIIPTTTATVTRAADAASMTGTNFSSWWNASAGTFAVSYVTSNHSNVPAVLVLGPTSSNSGFSMAGNSESYWNGATGLNTSNSVAVGALRSSAISYGSGRSICLNGGTVASDANVSYAGTPAAVYMGATQAGSQNINGYIRSIRYWPRRLSNAQLQALTR